MSVYKLLALLSLVSYSSTGQYTETINSNRPGFSYGAYSVGTNVVQGEVGGRYGNDNHDLLNTDTDVYNVDYSLRYGLFYERLEVILDGTYANETLREPGDLLTNEFNNNFIKHGSYYELIKILPDGTYSNEIVKVPTNSIISEVTSSNFRRNTIGAKYIIYDRYFQKEKEGPNVISWKADNTFQWDDFIPSVSAYAGANILLGESPFMFEGEPSLSPRVGIITQNNYKNWVFVTNFIADKFTTDFPRYEGIFTLTHTISQDFAVFGEYQFIINDLYSDDLFRFGLGFLALKDLQLDTSVMVNTRDTPSRWYAGFGISYRYDDAHKENKIYEDKK